MFLFSLEVAQELESVDAWQKQVHDDHVRIASPQKPQGGVSVPGAGHHVASRGEVSKECDDERPDACVVFDQEDLESPPMVSSSGRRHVRRGAQFLSGVTGSPPGGGRPSGVTHFYLSFVRLHYRRLVGLGLCGTVKREKIVREARDATRIGSGCRLRSGTERGQLLVPERSDVSINRALELNSVFSRLNGATRDSLASRLSLVSPELGTVLLEEGTPATHAYFPVLPAVISLLKQDAEGGTVEVGVVGHEGFASVSALLNPDTQIDRALVQSEGSFLRVESAVLFSLFDSEKELRHVMLEYVNYFTLQVAQTALCNRLHRIERRLARWLLMMRDRVGSNDLKLTQEFLSDMLGARTAGVNEAVQSLSRAGLIRHSRNRVLILDGPGLQNSACECYSAIRSEFERIENGVVDRSR